MTLPRLLQEAHSVKSFERSRNEKGTEEFIVDAKNTSAIHIAPKGRVVSKTEKTSEDSETLVFITPRIM